MTKIYIIAGEASGDFIGSKLITSLRDSYPEPGYMTALEFFGVGGRLMQEAGIASLFPISEISLMGFVEILPHIFQLKKLIKKTSLDIIAKGTDLLITIDSPGFTFRVAKMVRSLKPGIKLVHIVAPSVWAYKPGRAKKYAQIYDHLLALLPFEPSYFIKAGLNCSYIGHPIIEQEFYQNKGQAREESGSKAKTVICVTAGSRKGEIIRHMNIFVQALNIIAEKMPRLEVIFVLANPEHESLIKSFLVNIKFTFKITANRLKSFAAADAAIAKSGTNTLEIAASRTPMVVAYKINPVSFWLIRLMIKIKYASLINIISGREILPEFIQSDCTPGKIANKIMEILTDHKQADAQVAESNQVLSELGFQTNHTPSQMAAKIIIQEFLLLK